MCAKRASKGTFSVSWEWLYCWVTSASDVDERWRAGRRIMGRASSTLTTAPSSPQITAMPSPTASVGNGLYMHCSISPYSQSEQHRTQAQKISTSVSTPVNANAFLQSQEDIEIIIETFAAATESYRDTMTSTPATKSILTPSPLEMSMSVSALFNPTTNPTVYPSPPSSLAPLPFRLRSTTC